MSITAAQKNCLVVGAIFGLLYGYFDLMVLGITGLTFIAAAIHPVTASFLFRIWMWIGKMLGKINSAIILSVIFYFVLVPLSLIRKLLQKKPQTAARTTNFRTRNHWYTKDDLAKPW